MALAICTPCGVVEMHAIPYRGIVVSFYYITDSPFRVQPFAFATRNACNPLYLQELVRVTSLTPEGPTLC